jgi:hypothetical protein
MVCGSSVKFPETAVPGKIENERKKDERENGQDRGDRIGRFDIAPLEL